ncbi:hypothetical protein [Flavobacterium chungangense]|uniref:Uncharacterized protein n=1 Tax=Flavobacterium chungangense TaxID=554283 RepID=A0A6V6Z828_9FLAO|nr:hypothetical protein [Flavobacterium chungangense]CAD0007656.1 hypothetical protein FLACHUCJ7_03411 [Flavobacterium chungangense]
MINETLDYRWQKVKNGKPFFAIINLKISPNNNQNKIIEEYTGDGWIRMGDLASIPAKDEPGKVSFSNWRKAVIKGLEFVFCKTETKWTVKIKKVEGLIATDTNPTIVGYATILAFCKQTNIELDSDLIQKIEDFTFRSWEDKKHEKIPNFIDLNYENHYFK